MSEYMYNYLSLQGMVPSIVINDVLSELRAENDRLSGELVFANKCLHVLLKFKHYFYKNYLNVNNSNTQCYQTINKSLNALNGNNSDNQLKELENEFDVLLRERNAKMCHKINGEIDNKQIIEIRDNLSSLFVSTLEENTRRYNETKSEQIIDKRRVKKSFILPKVRKVNNSFVNKSKSETKLRETDKPKWKRPKRLKCDWNDCHHMARNRRELLNHKSTHFSVKPFKCQNNGCEKSFSCKDRLRDHIKYVHKLEKTIPCEWPECEAMFKNISTLNAHMKWHEIPVEKRPYVCDYIGCTFRGLTKSSLAVHMNKHSDGKQFKCDFPNCDVAYRNFQQLKRHKQKVHENIDLKVFRCDWPGCEYRSDRSELIKQHMSRHSDERRFVCTWPSCEQKLKSQKYLNHHMRIHMNDKRHACQWPGCEYRSVDNYEVTKHMRVHRKD